MWLGIINSIFTCRKWTGGMDFYLISSCFLSFLQLHSFSSLNSDAYSYLICVKLLTKQSRVEINKWVIRPRNKWPKCLSSEAVTQSMNHDICLLNLWYSAKFSMMMEMFHTWIFQTPGTYSYWVLEMSLLQMRK